MAKKIKEPDVAPTTYHLSRGQADAILNSAGLDLDAEQTGAMGKVVRHRRKWLPEEDSTTTIPLTPDELAVVREHLPRNQRLEEV